MQEKTGKEIAAANRKEKINWKRYFTLKRSHSYVSKAVMEIMHNKKQKQLTVIHKKEKEMKKVLALFT